MNCCFPKREGYTDIGTPRRSNNVWVVCFISMLIGIVSGTLYGFGRYSKDLKDLLGLSQIEISKIGIILDCGSFVGRPITGYIYDQTGSNASCLLAAIVMVISYMVIHLGISSSSTSLFHSQQWIIDISFLFVGLGSGLGYIVALGTTTKTFNGTTNKSKAIGFVAAGYGISASIVGVTYTWVGIHGFFLLWAIIVFVINSIGALYFQPPPSTTTPTTTTTNNNTTDEEQQLLTPPTTTNSPPTATTKWDTWYQIDFWLLFIVFACCAGCGLFVINNISTMVQSIGGSDLLASQLVVILSFSNVLGRILIGYLMDKQWTSQINLFKAVCLLMAFNMILSSLFYAPNAGGKFILYTTVILTAIPFGATWVLVVILLSQWFGNVHFGKDYGILAMAPALSGMVFNTMSAKLYQQHISTSTPTDSSSVCYGSNCYRGAFLITAVAAILGFLLLTYLGKRRQQLQQQASSSSS